MRHRISHQQHNQLLGAQFEGRSEHKLLTGQNPNTHYWSIHLSSTPHVGHALRVAYASDIGKESNFMLNLGSENGSLFRAGRMTLA
jgi:hypothetical protein